MVTPNTECSWDFTTKTRSTNDDGTSLDLEWEDEEGNLNKSASRHKNFYENLNYQAKTGLKKTITAKVKNNQMA